MPLLIVGERYRLEWAGRVYIGVYTGIARAADIDRPGIPRRSGPCFKCQDDIERVVRDWAGVKLERLEK